MKKRWVAAKKRMLAATMWRVEERFYLRPVGTKTSEKRGKITGRHGLRLSAKGLKKILHTFETVAIMRAATRFTFQAVQIGEVKKEYVGCNAGQRARKNRLKLTVGSFMGRTIHVRNRRLDFEIALLI